MNVGLIDVDGHGFPNIALMKLSAWHKQRGDAVEWWGGMHEVGFMYDVAYMSKVLDDSYSPDVFEPPNAREIIKGGTGYGLDNVLPDEAEHTYPDYSLYPTLTKDTAFGFLTRGCPRGCPFCIVAEKEGRRSVKVADLSEWWRGQPNIELCDPNTLACPEHLELLRDLYESGAFVNFNQGVDARLITEDNAEAISKIKLREIHFAWDLMNQSDAVIAGLETYKKFAKKKPHGYFGAVYTLVNFNTTMEENLFRIYKLLDMGFDPYVMIYDKPNAPQSIRRLQRWANNKIIRNACGRFEDYNPKKG